MEGAESFIELIDRLDSSYHGLIVGPVAENKKSYLEYLKNIVSKKPN